MSLPSPDFRYRGHCGFAARMSRQDLEPSVLGRARTPHEDVAYWEATCEELEEEFPDLDTELTHARAMLARVRQAVAS